MNKKIVAISVLLLMMCVMAASVFAEENRYEVVVVYETRGVRLRTGEWSQHPERVEVSIIVTASSVSEAESKAKDLVQAEKSPGRIISANAVRL